MVAVAVERRQEWRPLCAAASDAPRGCQASARWTRQERRPEAVVAVAVVPAASARLTRQERRPEWPYRLELLTMLVGHIHHPAPYARSQLPNAIGRVGPLLG